MDSRNPPPWRKVPSRAAARPTPRSTIPAKRSADSQEEAWVAGEDRFVLQQAKKKAAIRVKGGRAKPVDWLAVTLRFVDPTKTLLDEEVEDEELDIVDPEGVFEGLSDSELAELEKDIGNYLALETNRSNRDYWNTMKIICKERRQKFRSSAPQARGVHSVAADVERLLSPKSYEELEVLEKQIKKKLDSDDTIDVDYWEHLLESLLVWKAKARLKSVSQAIMSGRLEKLRKQEEADALALQVKVREMIENKGSSLQGSADGKADTQLDPEPSLKLRTEDKNLESCEESEFLSKIDEDRRRILKLGYVPAKLREADASAAQSGMRGPQIPSAASAGLSRFAAVKNEDLSQAANAMYEREVARGVEEGEEIFTGEEEVTSTQSGTKRPRYFNRVQMGYEWNKYNQTHYDHDNPPPKVVQGYKFNLFYPDLIDKNKAPTYRIEREHGRKRGQSFTPAGQDDTCLIRFIAGPPYEDVAFRIVDKEWDYSAKRERGFRSSFDKGVLQLHFQFKKIYYRK